MLPRPEVLMTLLRNPLSWLFILLNGLSTGISYLLQTREFPLPIVLLVAVFALGNMLYGIRIALRLMRTLRPSNISAEDR